MKRTAHCAIACLLLAGCDDERDLDGAWYSQIRTGAEVTYGGERIIVQDGIHDRFVKLLAEKVDKINANDLVISHLRPSARAPYTVFFPWEPSQIAKVTVGTE